MTLGLATIPRTAAIPLALSLLAWPSGCVTPGPGEDTETANDTGSTDTGASDTGLTGGTELPDECFAQDPAVDAAFVVELGDWGLDPYYDVTADCTVDALVEAAGGARLRTEMTCDHEGIDRTAALELAAPFSGPPTWAVGDAVRLRASHFVDNELAETQGDAVRLQRGETELLVFGYDAGALETPLLPDASWYAPIALEIDTTLCGGAPELIDPAPQQLLRGLVEDCCDGQVRGGQRALFDLSSAYSGFDVDAARVEVEVVGPDFEGGDGNASHLTVVMRAVEIGI